MILKNALVLDENFKFNKFDIAIKDERISLSKEKDDGEVLDLNGMYLIPGLIDTHIHGAYGAEADTGSNESLTIISEFEASKGVTTFVPTIRTLALSDMVKAVSGICASKVTNGAKIGGIHLEGPFVAEKYKGALLKEYIQKPDVDMLKSLCDAGKGLVRLITMAPELEGAKEVMEYAVSQNIRISMGHTNATFEETERAIEWGATQVTHTFNAMRPLNHRETGILGSVLSNENVVCELICDFIHIHPAAVKMVYKLKGSDRINIISDSCSVAGLDDGEYNIGGQTRYVKEGVVKTADGRISGGSKTVLEGIKNLVSIGIPLEAAVKTASLNPARTLGIEDETGSIKHGKYADLAVLDKELNAVCIFVNGKCIYKVD